MRPAAAASPIMLAWLLACSQGGTISAAGDKLPCVPLAARACPCISGGSGEQTCARSGLSFGACRGCGAEGAGADGGTSFDALGDAGALDRGEPHVGSVCGVGLPVLCAAREKCCARSLEVDTCIAANAACTCDLPDCNVVEVRCDGPEDCANGEVCCGTIEIEDGGGAHYSSFACAAQCTTQQNLACHDHGMACPEGLVCAESQLIANVQVCVDPASLAS